MAKPVRHVILSAIAVCCLISCEGAAVSESNAAYDGSGSEERCPSCPECFVCGINRRATADGNITEEYSCYPNSSSSSSTIQEMLTTPAPVNYGQCVPNTHAMVDAHTAIEFIMVVDQSSSMEAYIAWLKTFVPYLNNALDEKKIGSTRDCPNQFAAIGFGNLDDPLPIVYRTQGGASLFPLFEFADISRYLVKKGEGRIEYGYLAIAMALKNLPLRNSSRNCQVRRHLLLMTDEDNDVSDERITRRTLRGLLRRYQIHLHVMVDQEFLVDTSEILGMNSRRVGYSKSTNDDGCFNTSADAVLGVGYIRTRIHYILLALDRVIEGTAWNLFQLRTRAHSTAIRCALLAEILASSTFPQGHCYNCSCNSVGLEECQPAEASAAKQCACLRDNGLWGNGTCSFTNHSSCSAGANGVRLEVEVQQVATDIILIVEQSDFMEQLVMDFMSIIRDVDSKLLDQDIGQNSTCANLVSLVGFAMGKRSPWLYTGANGITVQHLTNVTNSLLQNWFSGSEASDGYQAIKFALDNIQLRPSSTAGCKRSRHMILMSDDDRTVRVGYANVTRRQLIDRLSAEHFKLHTVINSRFMLPDVKDVIGRDGTTGYVQSDASSSCFTAYPGVENARPYRNTTHDYTDFALALNGTAWDIYQLNSEPRRNVMACALAAATTSDLKLPGEYCTKCTCDVNGNEQCSSEASSNPGQCYCEHAGNKWHDGACRQKQETPVTDRPVKGSSMTTAIAAAAGAAGGCIVLLLVCAILILRRRRSRNLEDLKAVHKATPTRDLQSAAHHMMATMAAPAGSRLKIIPTEALSFRRCIGKGQYGEVHLGHLSAKNNKAGGEKENSLVAIKIMRSSDGSEEAQNQLLEEYFLQESVGEHPNIVKVILGGLFKAEPCIVMEYMAGGDLLQFLRNVKGASRLMNKGDDVPFLDDHEKLDISRQVSLGLEFLASKQIVHRDIAARNMLVREQKTIPGKLEVKISDWGLSRKAVADGAYQAQTSRMLPLKWMAVESIETGSFSEKSDVWSFGVLMWEVETGGEVPYAHIPNALLLQLVQNGQRLEKPRHCSSFVYSLMLRCWEADPSARPSFSDVSKELTSSHGMETNYIVVLGEGEAAHPSDLSPRDGTAPNGAAPTQPAGSALMSVFQRMRQETVDEEYMTMSPQIGEDPGGPICPEDKLQPEKSTPRYVFGQPTPQLPSEEDGTARQSPAGFQVDTPEH